MLFVNVLFVSVLSPQLQDERDTALDQLNMHDMQNTALKSNNNELMHALEGEQRRNVEMERVSIPTMCLAATSPVTAQHASPAVLA
jgi:hypothetical protein